MNKVEVDFGGWMKQAFELYKANFQVILLAGLIAMLLSLVSFSILAGPMMGGLYLVILALLDKTSPAPKPGDVFKGFQFFLPTFLVFLVIAIASAVLSAVIPFIGGLAGIVISAATMFSIPLIVDRQRDFWPAITESFKMVKPNFWPLLALVLLGGIIAQAGFIACCIGIFVTMPYAACLIAVAYRAHTAAGAAAAAPAPAPTVNPPPPQA